MEQIPDIVMQCPKCLKRFPMDQVYCEGCSAMLEPLEVEGGAAATGAEADTQSTKEIPDLPQTVTDEKIEDVKIDTLRVDIENKFVYTLILETDQLRKRLRRKEKSLEEYQGKEGGADHASVVAASGKIESEIDGIMSKITKLEMTIDNLRNKLTDDIAALDSEVGKLQRPGISGLLSEKGRYYRMLSSELKTKKVLLDVILGNRPPSALRIMALAKPAIIVPPAIVLLLLLALSVYTYMHTVSPAATALPHSRGGKGAVTEGDINNLLADIKKANLTKDLALWKSRYSSGYLAAREKKENIAEQWKKVDFTSLEYKVEDLQTGAGSASATITWDLEFKPRKSGDIKKITQRLRADFAVEDGRLKITSVGKLEP